jgi:predicted permease
MSLFLELLSQTLPLYLLIALGFLAGRYLEVSREATARLLIYVVAPAVVFYGALHAPLNAAVLSLPPLFFAICSLVAFTTYKVAKRWWKGAEKNILAFATGSGNTGYFGIPVALFLYGESVVPVQIVAIQGYLIFENTIGFYLTARGNFSAEESLRRVLKLPALYAFAAGLACQLLGVQFSGPLQHLQVSFRGAYTVLGMMLLGLGFSSLRRWKVDWKFVGVAFAAKFIAWPIIMGGILALNRQVHFFTSDVEKVLWLLAIVPLPVNAVAFASELRAEPEKTAMAVLLSTLFALVYIPFMLQ